LDEHGGILALAAMTSLLRMGDCFSFNFVAGQASDSGAGASTFAVHAKKFAV